MAPDRDRDFSKRGYWLAAGAVLAYFALVMLAIWAAGSCHNPAC